MSITDIALEAGFSDGAHLWRQFTSTYGLTPSAARAVAGERAAEIAGQRQFG